MESVGRLAGGIAHDFNNMLSVISGQAELSLEQINTTHPLHDNLTEIATAAQRSANLTRQLLAFARKQTISPRLLDLNGTIEDMLKMLRRLIGEDIDLVWMPDTDLGMVNIDPAQIDQILANLCVNVRDAISGVGKVTIETSRTTFDEAYCAERLDFFPGSYAMLAVSDDGCGMNKETQANLFEPFFTTKQVGDGTGLGLATVYGIVKQNDGFINVYSEPGSGTTFKIYLKQHEGEGETALAGIAAQDPRGSGETILLVEDEPMILNLGRAMLETLGYRVLTAIGPTEANGIAMEHSESIDLLITDVVMPEMNGRDLAVQLQTVCPGLKTLFMSGYTADVIASHGVLEKGLQFLQKPFSKNELATKVHEAITGK
jgi:two-component system, cell cycle sensor histidine kinase and response regulator CckA